MMYPPFALPAADGAAKLARQLGAQGALLTWDAGGNEFIEVVRTIQACEQLGIKTVFLTSEDDATDAAPTISVLLIFLPNRSTSNS